MRLLPLLLFLFLLLPVVNAATLQGTIYTPDLTIAKNVLVEIDTQPQQRYLSRDGLYSFQVPTGNYTLTVTFLQGNENKTLHEQVTVAQEGSFTFDLFLFPSIDEEELLLDDITTDFNEAPESPVAEEFSFPWLQLLLLLLLLALGLFGALRMRRPPQESDLTEEVIAIIKKERGRMTQKELRKRLPRSEAKISLLVNELVAKGKIEKIKKGRGNILVLKRDQ